MLKFKLLIGAELPAEGLTIADNPADPPADPDFFTKCRVAGRGDKKGDPFDHRTVLKLVPELEILLGFFGRGRPSLVMACLCNPYWPIAKTGLVVV